MSVLLTHTNLPSDILYAQGQHRPRPVWLRVLGDSAAGCLVGPAWTGCACGLGLCVQQRGEVSGEPWTGGPWLQHPYQQHVPAHHYSRHDTCEGTTKHTVDGLCPLMPPVSLCHPVLSCAALLDMQFWQDMLPPTHPLMVSRFTRFHLFQQSRSCLYGCAPQQHSPSLP